MQMWTSELFPGDWEIDPWVGYGDEGECVNESKNETMWLRPMWVGLAAMTCRRSLISSRAVSAYRPADLTTFRAECRFSLENVKKRSANIPCLQSAATEGRRSRLLPSLPMIHPSGPATPSEARTATEPRSAPPRSTEAEPHHLVHTERFLGQ